jgi:putative thioredoxin
MSQPSLPPISARGAVDLSALRQPPPPPAAGRASRAGGAEAPDPAARSLDGFVRDVTDATFGAVVELSAQVPVVVDLWAQWCGPCKQLSPVLERLAEEYGGAFLLAKVDVDANPQIAAAFQVQSIPSVVAIVGGQPVPMFQGAYPEAQVRAILDELLKVAAENGITGTLAAPTGGADGDAAAAAEPVEPPLPPLHQAAYDALEREDLDGAAQAFGRALRENPRDVEAKAGLAQVELLKRLAGLNPGTALATAAQAAADDVEAHLVAADVEVATGRAEAGLARLVALVRQSAGADRERVRVRLLDLFEVVGSGSPEVAAARRALASALY